MTQQEKEFNQNVVRVAMNLAVLIDIGLFPGKHALGLEECKGLVKSIIDDAQGKLAALTPPPAPQEAPPAA